MVWLRSSGQSKLIWLVLSTWPLLAFTGWPRFMAAASTCDLLSEMSPSRGHTDISEYEQIPALGSGGLGSKSVRQQKRQAAAALDSGPLCS